MSEELGLPPRDGIDRWRPKSGRDREIAISSVAWGTKENKWAGSQGERWMCVLVFFYINVLIIKYNHVFMTLLIARQVIRIFNLKEWKVFSWSVTRAARPSFASVRPSVSGC